MDTLFRDIRCALRRLAKAPAFTITALLTLAVCLGANLTIFGVVDAVLVRALPLPEADRLVSVYNRYPGAGVDRASASLPNYFDRRHAIKAFSSVSIYQEGSVIVGGKADKPNRVKFSRVSPEFFTTLGVSLAMGRTFTEEQLPYGQDEVAILTDEFWRVHFNGDPAILGRTFINDGIAVTVIGVLPPHFRFLSSQARFFRPSSYGKEDREAKNRHSNNWNMIARLAPGATMASAQAEIDAFNVHQAADDPLIDLVKGTGYHTTVVGLRDDHVQAIKPTLELLQAGVFCLLLIGSVNLVNLLLIRATGRSKELAVRQALGAGRVHIAREVLTETLVIGVGGSLLGLGFGALGLRLLHVLGTDQLPLGAAVEFDGRLALAALIGAVFVSVLLAAPVVWFELRSKVAPVLQMESRSGTASRGAQRLRHTFIVAQVALAFVLLAGAGLLAFSLKHVLSTSPGFNPDHILTGNITLPWKGYKEGAARLAFVDRLLPAIRALPGVTQVAVVSGLPFNGGVNDSVVTVEGYTPGPGETVRAHYQSAATADYWRLMNIPLMRGRFLLDSDNQGKGQVCVVDQAFANRYWPGVDPIGRRLADDVKIDDKNAVTVVGVVGNVKQSELAENTGHGAVYFPFSKITPYQFSLAIRCALPPAAVAPMIQKAVLQLDPELPIDDLRPMQARIDDTLVSRRSPAILAGIFAGVALLLAAIGTYGVLSYAVTQRQREIGVRIALGAAPAQIRNQFISVGVRVLAAGTVMGVVGAWSVGRAMQTLLFGVPALHWATLALAVGLMTIVTLAACLLPALRATRVDPVTALRAD